MDVEKIFSKIKELGHVNSKRDELRDYCKLKFDHVTKFLSRRILNSDGADLLDCLMNGLPDNPTSRSKPKVIDIVLQSMRRESTSLTHCGDVISRLCLELPRMLANDLVRWCNDSVQSVVKDDDINMIWRDVLPECLNALSSYDIINHCSTELSTTEYKEQCVHALCQCRWQEKQLVQLVAMFKDMQLSRNDHRQVVNKICSYVVDIPPDTLPPLVHQLLKLCKTYHIDIVLSHLSHYFNLRLYSKLKPPPQDSESTTMDIDDIVQHSPAELSRCLSTCIYHVSQGAADPALMRRQLKAWPKTQLLRAPFLVDLALAMSDKGAEFRTVCLDVIRLAIEQRVLDELKSKESAWARTVIPPGVDVAGVLKVLTTESANHRQLTVMGLINLAFSLLSVSKLKPTHAACRSAGKLILARVCKAQPETAPRVLAALSDSLASNHNNYDCLHVLCALSPVSLERCTELSTILENCQPSPADYKPAAAVLNAVHPLLNFSTRTRDALVMVCRKGLYSRDSMHRCLALSGFLTVLRHVKVSRTFPSSESACSEQYSAHSYLTQLTVDMHATTNGTQVTSRVRNEAMCMEVVSILRRCLLQDASVKQLLYTKIYDCAKEKPVLHESILELLYEHLAKYLPEDGENSLLFDKCVQMSATSAILVEPIAHLLYVIAQFLQPIEEEDDEDILSSQTETAATYLKNKLKSVMEQLSANESFGTIDVEDPGLTDLTPESKAKSLKVQQTLQCFEGLIAHQILQWTANSSDKAATVYRLFKAYDQTLEKTKSPSKLGKKGSKSTLNETRETVKSQKSQKSQKNKGKGPIKVSNLVKDKAGPFKALPCVWDLRLCLRVLELLYNENITWSSLDQRNQLRARRDFHDWTLKCVLSVLSTLDEYTDKTTVKVVADIASVMYRRCVCRFQDMCEFDDQTSLLCLEVFKECLTLLFSPSYSLKTESFLSVITGVPETTAPASIAAILEHIHTALTQVASEDEGETRDSRLSKAASNLANVAGVLLQAHVQSADTGAIILKLQHHVRTSELDCLSLIPVLLAAEFRELHDALFLDELLFKLTTALGRIDEEDPSAGEEDSPNFSTIDSKTGHAVLNHVCVHMNARFKVVEHLLLRAKDLTVALNVAVHGNQQRIDRELTELHKSIVIQLCQLSTWTSKICTLRCCVGVGSERVLSVCVRLYTSLFSVVKHFYCSGRNVSGIFERLLKLSGKKLSSVTDNLITYLEASQQQQSANKVLRDTKLIPRLVLHAEQFTKHVILLANKTKMNYQQYLSLGTARDFRIKGPVLQEVLQAGPRDDDVRIEDEESNNDEDTDMPSPASSESEDEDANDEEAPRGKRRRVS